MSLKLRYDSAVKWLAPVAALVLVGAALVPASAQIHGIPPSVTSLGGGHTLFNPPGIPASVTSLGPNGFQDGFRGGFRGGFQGNFRFGNNFNVGSRFRFRHGRSRFFFGDQSSFFAVPVAVAPYYSVMYDPQSVDQTDVEEDDGPGPTVFEHRGRYHRRSDDPDADSRDDSASERPRDRRASDNAPESSLTASSAGNPPIPAPPPETPQPTSILVFRDGHKLEVKNYAIVGDTLYDLTPGHPRKILLADLNLSATEKINDDRGVDFTAPVSK